MSFFYFSNILMKAKSLESEPILAHPGLFSSHKSLSFSFPLASVVFLWCANFYLSKINWGSVIFKLFKIVVKSSGRFMDFWLARDLYDWMQSASLYLEAFEKLISNISQFWHLCKNITHCDVILVRHLLVILSVWNA